MIIIIIIITNNITIITNTANNLLPGVRLDMGELEFLVARIHLPDLLSRRGAEDLDYLHQLVHATVPREDGLTQEKLGHHAPCGPDIWRASIVDTIDMSSIAPSIKLPKVNHKVFFIKPLTIHYCWISQLKISLMTFNHGLPPTIREMTHFLKSSTTRAKYLPIKTVRQLPRARKSSDRPIWEV